MNIMNKHICFRAKHASFCRTLKNAVRKTPEEKIVLGIETSCDDTGCAIMDYNGIILGESIHSQTQITMELGGVIPPIAAELHKENISRVVNESLQNANMSINDIDAVAVTTKPGLRSALHVGTNYGIRLCKENDKPFIPIHHMQAHALTARINHKIEFPFLVLLISGGHCLLSVAQSPAKFLLLGYSINDSPGEALDKTARRLKLRVIPEFRNCCGGEAVEKAAAKGNPENIKITMPMLHHRNCNFSFACFKQTVHHHVIRQEREHNIFGSTLIPDVYDFCASLLHTMTKHICHRVQRAMIFCDQFKLIPPENKILVVSGGVACNNYIKNGLNLVAEQMDYKVIVPPPKLCTDNGVMIAWNGIEKLRLNHDIIPANQLNSITVEPKSPIGEDITKMVTDASIKLRQINIDKLYQKTSEKQQSTGLL